jgi:hypothetical protein
MQNSAISRESIRSACTLLEELLDKDLDKYLEELITKAQKISSILPDHIGGPKVSAPDVTDAAHRLADRANKLFNGISSIPADVTNQDTG